MKSTVSKKRDFTLIKKYTAIYVVLLVAAILIMVDHYYETPVTLADVQLPPGVDVEKSEVGFKAPAFTVRNLKGHRVQLADHKGKVIILNLWATWCGPCRIEMPGMEKLYRRYRTQGLEILAVSLDKGSADKVQTFADEYRLSFPVILMENRFSWQLTQAKSSWIMTSASDTLISICWLWLKISSQLRMISTYPFSTGQPG